MPPPAVGSAPHTDRAVPTWFDPIAGYCLGIWGLEGERVAFDEVLAARIRGVLGGSDGLAEKKMFGGLAFLLNGNMCCGVHGDDLILRLPPEQTEEALKEPNVRVFDMTGRPMKGWVLIAPGGVASDDDLSSWVGQGLEFARSLPAK